MKYLIVVIAMFASCAFFDSFKERPGQSPIMLPITEYVAGTNMKVTVQVYDNGTNPYCSMPDSSSEISCKFSYEWFESASMLSGGSYLFLDPRNARTACHTAMWSAQGGPEEIEACARALLYYRLAIDGDYGSTEE